MKEDKIQKVIDWITSDIRLSQTIAYGTKMARTSLGWSEIPVRKRKLNFNCLFKQWNLYRHSLPNPYYYKVTHFQKSCSKNVKLEKKVYIN